VDPGIERNRLDVVADLPRVQDPMPGVEDLVLILVLLGELGVETIDVLRCALDRRLRIAGIPDDQKAVAVELLALLRCDACSLHSHGCRTIASDFGCNYGPSWTISVSVATGRERSATTVTLLAGRAWTSS
jgi:hypothetical protein